MSENETHEVYFHPNIQDKFGFKGMLHIHNAASIFALIAQMLILISAMFILIGTVILILTFLLITIHHFLNDRNPSVVPNRIQDSMRASDLELSTDEEDNIRYVHKARKKDHKSKRDRKKLRKDKDKKLDSEVKGIKKYKPNFIKKMSLTSNKHDSTK